MDISNLVEYNDSMKDRMLGAGQALPTCLSPLWLLTCTQILSEGLAQLSRIVCCTNVVHQDNYSTKTQPEVPLVRDQLLPSASPRAVSGGWPCDTE